jgi:hypothetical protein
MLGQQIFDARTSLFFHGKTLWSTKSFLGTSSAHKALQSPLTEVARRPTPCHRRPGKLRHAHATEAKSRNVQSIRAEREHSITDLL